MKKKIVLLLVAMLIVPIFATSESSDILNNVIPVGNAIIDPLAVEYPPMYCYNELDSDYMIVRSDIAQWIISTIFDDQKWDSFSQRYTASSNGYVYYPFANIVYYAPYQFSNYFRLAGSGNILLDGNRMPFVELNIFKKAFSIVNNNLIIPDEYIIQDSNRSYVNASTDSLEAILLANSNSDAALSTYIFPKIVLKNNMRPDAAVTFIEAFCSYQNQDNLTIILEEFEDWYSMNSKGLPKVSCGQVEYQSASSILINLWTACKDPYNLFEVHDADIPTIETVDDDAYFAISALQYAFESALGEPLDFSEQARLTVCKHSESVNHEPVTIEGQEFYNIYAIDDALYFYSKTSSNLNEYQQ